MRLAVLAFLLVAAALLAPAAIAQTAPDFDITIELPSGAARGAGIALADARTGESYSYTLNLSANYTTFEVRATGLDIARPQQLVPHLRLDPREGTCHAAPGACDYTIFEPFPNERVWEVDSPARVFFTSGNASDVALRLGVPGPVNATLVLERDVTPPTFVIHPRTNVTTFSFLQETETNELAIGDLQVRAVGTSEWIVNPTPIYHFIQRFPVQGLSPNRTYETRFVFTDRAGNNVTVAGGDVTTLAEPQRAPIVVTAVAPLPNATVPAAGVVVRAHFASAGAPVARDGVRLFFDLHEVSNAITVENGDVRYTAATPLEPGPHRVSVEVLDTAGGKGDVRWSFTVGGAATTPAAAWFALVAMGAAGVLLARRGMR